METLLTYNKSELITDVIIAVMVVIALWETSRKLLEILNNYYKKRRNTQVRKETLEHLKKNDSLQEENLKILLGATKIQMRHSIVRIAEESLKSGKIGAYELRSLEELFECYGDPHGLDGNSYVHNLMDKVRELPIDYTNGNPDEM